MHPATSKASGLREERQESGKAGKEQGVSVSQHAKRMGVGTDGGFETSALPSTLAHTLPGSFGCLKGQKSLSPSPCL